MCFGRAIAQASANGGNATALAAAIAIANAAPAGNSFGGSSVLAQALSQAVALGANASAVSQARGVWGGGRHASDEKGPLATQHPSPLFQALAQATAAAAPASSVPQPGASSAAAPASSQALSQALASGNSTLIANSLAQSSGGENLSSQAIPAYISSCAFCLLCIWSRVHLLSNFIALTLT